MSVPLTIAVVVMAAGFAVGARGFLLLQRRQPDWRMPVLGGMAVFNFGLALLMFGLLPAGVVRTTTQLVFVAGGFFTLIAGIRARRIDGVRR